MPAEELPADVLEARRKLRERMGDTGAQVGGKGSMRRKSKPIPKSTHNDDKKVGEIAKKAGLQEIPGMDEANIIMNDGNVIQFSNPKVRGLMSANAFVLFGTSTPTTINKLSAELRGEGMRAGPGMPQIPANIENLLKKFQNAMEQAGLNQTDLADPAKQGKIQDALSKAGLTEEEAATLQALMGATGGAGAEEEMPELSGSKTFEEVSDAD